MIQRIQTIFLLLAAIILGITFAFPFVRALGPTVFVPFLYDGVYNVVDHPALIVTFAATALLCLLSIFLFNNRPLQMRVTMLSVLLTIVCAGLTIFLFTQLVPMFYALSLRYSAGLFLPLGAILFQILAYRGIKKDERTVRSMDRLR